MIQKGQKGWVGGRVTVKVELFISPFKLSIPPGLELVLLTALSHVHCGYTVNTLLGSRSEGIP